MKVVIKTFVFIMMMSFSNLAFASDWAYAGKSVLRNDMPIAHHADGLLMNHLTSYSNQPIGIGESRVIVSMTSIICMIMRRVVQEILQKSMFIKIPQRRIY